MDIALLVKGKFLENQKNLKLFGIIFFISPVTYCSQ